MAEPVRVICVDCGGVAKELNPEEAERYYKFPDSVYAMCSACVKKFKGVL